MNANGTAPETNRLRQAPAWKPAPAPAWGYGQDRPHLFVQCAVQTLTREGLAVCELPALGNDLPCRWAKAVAECLARGECSGGVLFCEDPGLVSCVANKVAGLRAVPVLTVGQAARATLTLAANLLVVEMPGRTFFEIRQILRTLFRSTACPEGVACTLRELDGHAHRAGDR
jgi:ribose 5-phosphate isomerase RpiB